MNSYANETNTAITNDNTTNKLKELQVKMIELDDNITKNRTKLIQLNSEFSVIETELEELDLRCRKHQSNRFDPTFHKDADNMLRRCTKLKSRKNCICEEHESLRS